jgi:hypothetical protein
MNELNNMPKHIFRKIIIPAILVFFIAGAALMAFVYADKKARQEQETESIVPQKTTFEKKDDGKVLGEEEAGASSAKFQSADFRVPQIVVGAEGGIFYPGAGEQKDLAIGDVKSEIFTDKSKKGKKILLSWMTNKPAKSAIEYSKAGLGSGQTYEESGYSLEHSVLLEPLENSTTYNYVISMRDRSGKTVSTDKFAIYTGAAEVSFFDLIAGAFKGVFGWAAK